MIPIILTQVATLNDEKNWRTGMRVELLLKRMVTCRLPFFFSFLFFLFFFFAIKCILFQEKYGLVQKGHKGTFSEKNNDIQTAEMTGDGKRMKSVDYHDEMAEKVVGNS